MELALCRALPALPRLFAGTNRRWTIACSLAWLVLIGLVLFLVRQYGKGYYAGASGFRKILQLLAAPAGALAVSMALFAAGFPLSRSP